MAILNFQIAPIGESGQVPKFIYFLTDNTASEVIIPGYLNSFVAQGNLISNADAAVVSTRTNPNAVESSVGLYNIELNAGIWSLIPMGGSSSEGWAVGGNTFVDAAEKVFGSLTNNPISFGANGSEYMKFVTSPTKNIELDVEYLIVSANGGTVNFQGTSNIFMDPTAQVQIAASASTSYAFGHYAASGVINADQLNIDVQTVMNIATNNAATLNLGHATMVGNLSFDGLSLNAQNNVTITSLSGWTHTAGQMDIDVSTGGFSVTANAGGIDLHSVANIFNIIADVQLVISSDDLRISVGVAGLNIQGLTNTASSATVRPLLIDTAAGPGQFKIFYET